MSTEKTLYGSRRIAQGKENTRFEDISRRLRAKRQKNKK
jgi:hypothetical protein